MIRFLGTALKALALLTMAAIFCPDATAQPPPTPGPELPSAQEPQSSDVLEEPIRQLLESQAAYFAEQWERQWAPTNPGTYVALADLGIQRLRVQYAAPLNDKDSQGPANRSFPRFTVILTLGASPSKAERSIKEAFFHTGSLSEALAVIRDLKSGTVKGLWIQRFQAKTNRGEVRMWWDISGLEY